MSHETKLLSQKNARAGLFTKHGASFFKDVIGVFLGDLADLADAAIDGWIQSDFVTHFEESVETKQGDIEDILGKFSKMTEIALTDQNFLLLYKKGIISKKQKLIMIPLKNATDVETMGWLTKSVLVTFEVPQKEKERVFRFALALGVKHSEMWIKAIEQAIGKTPRIMEATRGIPAKRFGLIFTENSIIGVKISVAFALRLLGAIISAIGFFLLFGIFVVMTTYRNIIPPTPLEWMLVLAAAFGPPIIYSLKSRSNRLKLNDEHPELLLNESKDNFQINHDSVVSVEIFKGGLIRRSKVRIQTSKQLYELKFDKKRFDRYFGLTRSVFQDKVKTDFRSSH